MEDFLTEEVRALPHPDGGVRHVRSFKLTWVNYDIVLQHGPLSALEISTLMHFYAEKNGYDLGHALREVLVPLRREANRVMDRKLAVLKRKSAMRENLRGQFSGAADGSIKPGEAKDPKPSTPLVFRKALGQSRRAT